MVQRNTIGVAVGKFNPPHLGHAHLLVEGARHVEHLYVLLADRPDQTIPAQQRSDWLQDAVPDNVTIIVTSDDLPEANEPWAARALELLPEPPTLAVTSEPWGPGWAEAMGARHLTIDIARKSVPISGSQLREDLRANFGWLVPAARAGLARRVVIAGAESTGKTTIAATLARHYGTVWVPEYGRFYWNSRRHLPDQRWAAHEFTHIAQTHHEVAGHIARNAAGGLVVLDTDALVTDVWRRRYLGDSDPELLSLAHETPPTLYLVCAPDFAWTQDGTRESEAHREAMHTDTLDAIAGLGVDHVVLTGGREQRLAVAIEAIDTQVRFPKLV